VSALALLLWHWTSIESIITPLSSYLNPSESQIKQIKNNWNHVLTIWSTSLLFSNVTYPFPLRIRKNHRSSSRCWSWSHSCDFYLWGSTSAKYHPKKLFWWSWFISEFYAVDQLNYSEFRHFIRVTIISADKRKSLLCCIGFSIINKKYMYLLIKSINLLVNIWLHTNYPMTK
jgi:hypothetical protein